MSLFTDGLPAWWAMVVAVAALLTGVWLGELHGRGAGRGQEREDRKADAAVRQVRSWRDGRGERTAAFLNPDVPVMYGRRRPRAANEDPHLIDKILAPEVAHEAWLAHTEQAMDLASGTVLAPEDQALLDELVAGLDAWRAANL